MVGACAPSVLDVADRELVLQISGSTRHGQVVRLKSSKCTIGSGRHCTLRLRARGVQPLHCLILRGAGGTVIRRLAPDTRLNGSAFADAELVPGDRLGIGPLEFEVLDPGRSPGPRPLPTPQSRGPQPAEPGPNRRKLDQLTAKLASANRHGRARARRLIHELRSARRETARLQQQQRTEADETQSLRTQKEQLDQHRSELDARAGELGQLEKALQQKEEILNERQRALSQRDEALNERQQALSQREEALNERQKAVSQREEALNERQKVFAERSEQLDRARADLDSERQAFDTERERWAADRSAAEAHSKERWEELESRRAGLDALRAELDARESEIDEKSRQFEAQQAEAEAGPDESASQSDRQEEVRFEEPSPGSPASSGEVLRRVGMVVSFSDEEADGQRPAPPGPTQSRPAETPGPLAQSDGGEDESIDDYMARLLDRVRETTGRPSSPIASPSSAVTAAVRRSAAPSAPGPTDSPPQSPSPAAEPQGPAEMSPRAVAPEKSVDLTAMRELANFSAHTAITRHARRVLFGTVVSKFLVTIVASAAGAILMWVWWTKAPNDFVLYAAVASFLVALSWSAQYAKLLGHAIWRKSDRADWKHQSEGQAEEDVQESP